MQALPYAQNDTRSPGTPAKRHEHRAGRILREYAGILLVLAGMVGFFSIFSRHFLSPITLVTISNQIPSLTVTAVGMTFVILIAGIDLSVGSVMALCGTMISVAMVDWGWTLLPSVLVGIGVGVACGLVNGAISVVWRVPSFIVTLGMMEMARGAAYLVTDSRTKYIGNAIDLVSAPLPGGISSAFLVSVLIVILGQLTLKRTVLGRFLVGIGTNEKTLKLSGIDTRLSKISVFVISGFLVSIASVFHCSRLQAADPNAGAGLELQVIAAVVIGGTSLLGGRGSVVKSFFGVLIISVLEHGLSQLGVHEPTKRLITGCFIIVAVILDMQRKHARDHKD